jgi:CheY-like chemotaxis protein
MALVPILLVENDAVVARVLTVLLERWQYAVAVARDAGEALSEVQKKMPAAIVTDVSLPGLDGLQLVRALKADAATRPVPIIAIHCGVPEQEQSAFAAGCAGSVGKPLDTHRLFALLRVLAPAL